MFHGSTVGHNTIPINSLLALRNHFVEPPLLFGCSQMLVITYCGLGIQKSLRDLFVMLLDFIILCSSLPVIEGTDLMVEFEVNRCHHERCTGAVGVAGPGRIPG